MDATFIQEYSELRLLIETEFSRGFIRCADIHLQLQYQKYSKRSHFMNKFWKWGTLQPQHMLMFSRRFAILKMDYRQKIDFKYILYGWTFAFDICKISTGSINTSRRSLAFCMRKKCHHIRSHHIRVDEAKEKKCHCYNCGSVDHLRKDWIAATKCFWCNKEGHMPKNCTVSCGWLRSW